MERGLGVEKGGGEERRGEGGGRRKRGRWSGGEELKIKLFIKDPSKPYKLHVYYFENECGAKKGKVVKDLLEGIKLIGQMEAGRLSSEQRKDIKERKDRRNKGNGK